MTQKHLPKQGSCENPASLIDALANTPLTYLTPKQQLTDLLRPYNTKIHSQNVIFKNGQENPELDDVLISEIGDEEPELKFIKFFDLSQHSSSDEMNHNDHNENLSSKLQQHLVATVSKVGRNDYQQKNFDFDNILSDKTNLNSKIDLLIGDQKKRSLSNTLDFDKKRIKLEVSDTEDTRIDGMKAQFEYKTQLSTNDINNINVHGLEILIEEIFEREDSYWVHYPLLFDASDDFYFIKPQYLMQIKGYLTSINETSTVSELKASTLTKLQSQMVSTLTNIQSLEWDLFLKLTNPLEFQSLISIWETSIACTFILIKIISTGNDLFTENQMGYIWKTIILLASNFKALYSLKFPCSLTFQLRHLVDLYTTLLQRGIYLLQETSVEENFLGELEYVFMELVFIELDKSQKDYYDIYNALEYLRKYSSDVLISIYQNYFDQRDIILSDLVDKFHLLPHLKAKSKQFRLGFGLSVQVFSVLIVELVQSYASIDLAIDKSYWRLLDIPTKTKSEKEIISQIDANFKNSLNENQLQIQQVSDKFMQLLFKRIVNDFTVDLKRKLELFFNDILKILEYPQFPGSETLLHSALNICMKLIMSEMTPASVQAYCVEIIGLVLSNLLTMKNNHHVQKIPIELTVTTFEMISGKYQNVLSYLKTHNTNSFYFLAFKYIAFLEMVYNDSESEETLKSLVDGEKQLYVEQIFGSGKSNSINHLTLPEIMSDYQYIVFTQKLTKGYSKLLNLTFYMLNDSKVKVRSAAIKSLTLFIENDAQLLSENQLKNMIKTKLCESFSNVSDSILDLLSKYLKLNSSQIEEYFDLICQRAYDSNVSIKKKAIKLIIQLYYETSKLEVRTRFSEVLLSKLVDDDASIAKLSAESLMDLWFTDTGRKFYDEENVSSTTLRLNKHIDGIIEVMTYIFKKSDKTWTQFERFVKEKVSFINELNKGKIKLIKFSLQNLIKRILEHIVETNGENHDKESLMALVSVLIKSDNKLISQNQLLSLQPYIIDDFNSSSKLCYYTLQVLNMALTYNTKNLDEGFIETCRKSLLVRLTKFYALELNEAMQCIWKLSKLSEKNIENIGNACIRVIKMLLVYSTKKKMQQDFEGDSKLRRLLFLVGSFGKHCNFEIIRYLFVQHNIGLKKESVMMYLLNNILYYCDSSVDANIRSDAIKNALGICITHPKTFRHPRVMVLMDSGFKKRDEKIKVVIINSITSFMTKLEMQSNERNGLELKKSDEVEFDEKVYHGESKDGENDAICSNLVQKYFNAILECCLSKDEELALISIRFLQLAVNFGFAIPMICFPTISALECSKSGYVKQIAMGMHQKLFEDFSSLIESCYIPAFKTTVEYANKIYPGLNILRCQNYLKYFIKLVKDRSNSIVKLRKVYCSVEKLLVKNVDIIEFSQMTEKQLVEQQRIVTFMCLNMSCIEYSTLEELLLLLSFIDKLFHSQCSNVTQHYQLLFYEGDDDGEEWFKYMVMAKCLILLHRVKVLLMQKYSVTSLLLLQFREDSKRKEFLATIHYNSEGRVRIDDLDLMNHDRSKKQVSLMCEALQSLEE